MNQSDLCKCTHLTCPYCKDDEIVYAGDTRCGLKAEVTVNGVRMCYECGQRALDGDDEEND